LTGAANVSAGPQPLTPRTVRPQQAGRSKIWPPKKVGDAARRFAGEVGIRILIGRRSLGRLPAREAGSGSSGVSGHPNREGLPVQGGWRRSPSLLFPRALSFFSSGHSCRSSRAKPRPGCVSPRRGFAADATLGGEAERRCGTWERAQTPRFLRVALRVTLSRRVLWAEGRHERSTFAQAAMVEPRVASAPRGAT